MYISPSQCSETTCVWQRGLLNMPGCVYSKHCTAHPHCVFTGVWSVRHRSLRGLIWCRSYLAVPRRCRSPPHTLLIRKKSVETERCIFTIRKMIFHAFQWVIVIISKNIPTEKIHSIFWSIVRRRLIYEDSEYPSKVCAWRQMFKH